jgi:folate-binding protein YgfZ
MSGMRMEGYRALREGAALLDLAGRGKIAVHGEDRARLLHALCTNQIEELALGGGCYAFFLNAQGRILGDANVFRMSDHFLLDTEPELASKLYGHIDRYIIADDVTLEDLTGSLSTIGLEGPRASDILIAAGAPVPEAAYAHVPWGERTVARANTTGAGGFLLFVPVTEKDGAIRTLEAAGAVPADAEAARVVRVENRVPRYGEDITETSLPQETRRDDALNFNKGCYLGQEIVERIRSRGHVNRFVVGLEVEGDQPPPAGAAVLAGGNETGQITSSVFSPASGKTVALGYVRASDARPGTLLAIDGVKAVVSA